MGIVIDAYVALPWCALICFGGNKILAAMNRT